MKEPNKALVPINKVKETVELFGWVNYTAQLSFPGFVLILKRII